MLRPIPLPRGVVLNRATFLLGYGLFMAAHRVHPRYRAYEWCDVGRKKVGKNGRVLAVLQPPPLQLWVPSLKLWEVAGWLRDQARASVHVSSGYRDPVYNLAIGGVEDSVHTYGIALDVLVDGRSPLWVGQALASHPDAHLLGLGVYQTFTHFDVRGMMPPGFFTETKPIPGRWSGKGVRQWWT